MQIGQIVQYKLQSTIHQALIDEINDKRSIILLEDGQKLNVDNEDLFPCLQTQLYGDQNKSIIKVLEKLQKSDETCTQIGNIILSTNKAEEEIIQVKKQSISFENYINQTGIEGYDILPYMYSIYTKCEQAKQFIWITGQNNKGKPIQSRQLIEILAENMEDSIDAQVLKQQIQASDYILDTFTSTSNGSKMLSIVNIQIQQNKMIGLKYDPLLYDKHRITLKDNFQIIYHMQSLSQDEKDKFHLNAGFPWLEPMKKKIDFNINWFALFQLDDIIDQIYGILAGLMHLRNVEFTTATPPSIQNPETMDIVKNLLQIDGTKFNQLITMKYRKVGAQMIETPMQSIECRQMRDFIMRDIYEKLVMKLVEEINKSISKSNSSQIHIFQFFHQPSQEQFENLSLNYFNEKIFLQQQQLISDQIQLQLKSQSLSHIYQSQMDNRNIIDFLEAPQIGMLSIIDESTLALSDDNKLFDKLKNTNKINKLFQLTKTNLSFQINHSFGTVEYQLNTFRSINKDELPQLFIDTMNTSKNPFLKSLYPKTLKQVDKTELQKMKSYFNNLSKQSQDAEHTIIQCVDLIDKDSTLQYTTQQLLNLYAINQPISISNIQFEKFKVLNVGKYQIHQGITEVFMSAEVFNHLQTSLNDYVIINYNLVLKKEGESLENLQNGPNLQLQKGSQNFLQAYEHLTIIHIQIQAENYNQKSDKIIEMVQKNALQNSQKKIPLKSIDHINLFQSQIRERKVQQDPLRYSTNTIILSLKISKKKIPLIKAKQIQLIYQIYYINLKAYSGIFMQKIL